MSCDIGALQTGQISLGPLQVVAATPVNETFTNSFTFSDAFGFTVNVNITIIAADAFTFSDEIDVDDIELPVVNLTFVDSISFSDAFNLNCLIDLGFSDGIVFNDAFGDATSLPLAGFNDFFNFADRFSKAAEFFLAFSDSFNFADLVTLVISPFAALSFTDDFNFTDAISIQLFSIFINLPISFVDVINFQDSFQILVPYSSMSFSDSFMFQDVFAINMTSDLISYIRRYLNDVITEDV